MVMPNDYAELDATMFPDGDTGAEIVTAPAEQGDQSATTQPAADPFEERFRRLENTIQSANRQLQRVIRERGEPPDSMTQALSELRDQFADMKEQREFESLTLEEQNAKLREQRDAARKVPETAQQPQELNITRTEDWFVQGLTDEYQDDIVPELNEMAEDLGITLSQQQLDNLHSYALTRENGPQIVTQGGQHYLAWDDWLRKVIRPALREEAKRQASEGQPAARQRSAARANPAALGNGSRAAAGGTARLNFFDSSIGQEIAAAGWGDLR